MLEQSIFFILPGWEEISLNIGNKGQNKRQTFNFIKIETFPMLRRTKILKLKLEDNIIKKPFLAIMQIIRTDH